MNKEAKLEVAWTSRHRADLYLKRGNPGRAFSHLLVALQLCPNWKEELKNLFASTLCTWGRLLESKNRYCDLFTCYEQAVIVFPDNEEVLNNLGAHLFRMGYLNEACNYFHKALDVNNGFLPAYRNLENMSNLLVQRWHFRMLNDTVRNQAYREAVMKKVGIGFNTVLDIGTGTGILSLFAVEAGAREVYACDCSEVMINIAKDVMQANNASTKVVLINKLSNDLVIPHDIPHKLSLVVTETLDAGLLGEHVLQTLVHAWDYLLLPPAEYTLPPLEHRNGVVVPLGATIWVAAIECSYIAIRSRLHCEVKETEMDESHTDDERNDDIQFYGMNLIAIDDEPYDTQDLNRVPEGFRFLTSPVKAMTFNFNDQQDMRKYLNKTHDIHQFTVKCTKSGCLDAMAVWFDLQLDEDIVLSSSPEEKDDKACCWDQTIFPMSECMYVVEGQHLEVKVSANSGKLSVKVERSENNSKPDQPKLNNLTFKDENQMMTRNLREKTENGGFLEMLSEKVIHGTKATDALQFQVGTRSAKCCHSRHEKQFLPVSQDIITFLNDQKWMDALSDAANILLQDPSSKGQEWNILDLSPFPVLGLTLLKNVIRINSNSTKWDQLTCVAKDKKDEEAIRHIAELNGIDNAHIECIKEELLEDSLDSSNEFDIVLLHLVNSRGELQELYVNALPILMKSLKKNGLLLPWKFSISCQLIHSDWLAEVSRSLGGSHVCGYKVAEYINPYQVLEHRDFPLSSLDYVACSDTFEVLSLDCTNLVHTVQNPLTVKVKVPITCSGLVNAIPYWFNVQLFGTSLRVSTLNSYANQSAVLLNPEFSVTTGENIEVMLTCHQGLIHAGLEKREE